MFDIIYANTKMCIVYMLIVNKVLLLVVTGLFMKRALFDIIEVLCSIEQKIYIISSYLSLI